MSTTTRSTDPVIHWAWRYDLLVWLLTLGRERKFRESLLAPARLQSGESALDIGCGTGTLAIAAKRHVGPTGAVCGIDPSPEMIARARRKSRKAALDVVFTIGAAEALPFADGAFDIVLSTAMLHHLTAEARPLCAREMRRVLKPHGRVLAVDFVSSWHAHEHRGFLAHLHHHLHGAAGPEPSDMIALFDEAGLECAQTGSIGIRNLQFVLGRRRP